MQVNEISVNNDLMEITQHRSPELPMQVYTDYFGNYLLKDVNWRWHNEFEFAVVLRGTTRFLIGDTELTLAPGEGIPVNSGVLHQVEPVGAAEETENFSALFSPQFIASFDQGNIFDKYVMPVMLNQRMTHLALKPEVSW